MIPSGTDDTDDTDTADDTDGTDDTDATDDTDDTDHPIVQRVSRPRLTKHKAWNARTVKR